MTRNSLLKKLKTEGSVLAKNSRPLMSIMSMSEFVRVRNEKYTLLGFIYGRPVLLKTKKAVTK